MDEDQDQDQNQEQTGYLSTLRDFAFISAVYLYFIGWIYCYYYLISFGVGIRTAGIELYSMIIYSTGAFSYYAGSFLFWLGLVAVAAGLFAVRFWAGKKKQSPLPKYVLTVALLAIFIVAFPLAKKAGVQTAARDKVPATTDLSRMYIGFTKEFLTFEPTNLMDSGSYYRKIGAIQSG